MGEIVRFTGETKGHIDPDVVVGYAGDLKESIVIGVQENGELYICGSDPDLSRAVHLLALAQKYMLEMETD